MLNSKKKYFVSYDLNAPGKDYSRVIGRIRELGGSKALKSSYYVNYPGWAFELKADLGRFMDINDEMVILEVTSNIAERLRSTITQHLRNLMWANTTKIR